MLYIQLSGRFGNYLFQIAAGASIAKKYNMPYKVVILPDNQPISTTSDESMSNYLKKFKETVFSKIEFTQDIPSNTPQYSWFDFPYKLIPFNGEKDLIINGYFQSYKYLDDNYIRELYSVPEIIKESLTSKYPLVNKPYVCIHVRRGDYCNLPHRFSICSMKYFRKAMDSLGKDLPFVVISDDIKWCKRHFHNVIFADKNNSLLEDFYLQALATHNIISNSSFSWWGAWLNSNKNKKVIYPSPWFGPHYSHYDTSDLCPSNWICIKNTTPTYYRIKSIWIRLKMKTIRLFNFCTIHLREANI